LGALGLGIMLIALYMPDGLVRFVRERGRLAASLLERRR
jgi:hypothetical protein